MNQVDSLERMYQEFKSIVEFRVIYIQEAHAADSRRPSGLAIHLGISEHTTVFERCTEAKRLLEDKTLTIPMLIDGIDDAVSHAYSAHPDRFFVVRTDGRLAVAAARGPHGFGPAMEEGQQWLAEFKRTGEEPELSDEVIATADRMTEERMQRQSAALAARLSELAGTWKVDVDNYEVEFVVDDRSAEVVFRDEDAEQHRTRDIRFDGQRLKINVDAGDSSFQLSGEYDGVQIIAAIIDGDSRQEVKLSRN